jgi:hypothetical protein
MFPIREAEFKINSKVFSNPVLLQKNAVGDWVYRCQKIVEEYHNGTIKVLNSEIGKGTTMQVSFKKNSLTQRNSQPVFREHRFLTILDLLK